MTKLSTQSKSQVRNMAVGRYIEDDTAVAFKITTGFKPRYVKVQNLAATGCAIEWYEGMTAAYGVKRVVAGDFTMTTSLGITVAEDGFTVGLDLDLNVVNEQMSWIAIG